MAQHLGHAKNDSVAKPAGNKRWLEARQAELLPVDYYHVVFTLPAPISAVAYYNKAVI
jgi:hypothetical protein